VVDISNFFAMSHLSRLRFLDLYGNFWISSWDHLASRTTFLTALLLEIGTSPPSPTLTTSQLFSILASNPNLQELLLSDVALPNDSNRSTLKVPLRNLKMLALAGEFRHIFGLLRQLILPGTLDEIFLTASNSTVEDISHTLAQYMRDYFRRDARFQGKLGVSSSIHTSISIAVGVVRTQTTPIALELPRVMLTVLAKSPPFNVQEQFFVDLIALTPRERVVSFDARLSMQPPEELFLTMPNIETLHLCDIQLLEGFLQPDPDGPHANTKLLPSLRSLCLENIMCLNNDDWGLLRAYLAHQTSDDQTISLKVIGDFPDDCPEVVNGIKDLVKEFIYY